MADLNIQSNHGNYTDNIQSDQLNSINSSDDHHTNGCPLNQTIPTDFDYTNMEQPITINSNGVYSYHHSQMPPQPSDMGFLSHDSIYMGMNESLNTENYGCVGNGENGANYSTMNYNSSNYNPHSIYCLPPQTDSGYTHNPLIVL
ncbi:7977_t:CDS:2 [Paraglomus occultum]|uniref:7977_t:CDS:1 n=1 Tax=Paraglomus occultum TaxID=144539 RepID=A0A9N9G106_9GLOM|nr:7977_t:CDS:2 [Paraglomus occultum]